MLALKLTGAGSSICVRTAATPATVSKAEPALDLPWSNRNIQHQNGREITACAHTLSPAHDKGLGLTFGGRKSPPFSSVRGSSSFSVENSGCLRCGSGSPSRSDFATDMGSKIKNRGRAENDVFLQKEAPPPSMKDSPQPSKLLTLPTILTLGRVAAVPLLVATFYVNGWWGTAAATSIFIAAAITDWLDGYIARKMKLKSTFGAFLDPVADKLMVAATLILLCTRPLEVAVFGQASWLLTIPSISIIGREITMSAVREWAASQDSKLLEAVAVNNLGKWKTATQMTALTVLLATRDCSYGVPAILVGCGVVLLYISAWLAVWSLIVYMRKIWKVLLNQHA